MANLVKEQSWGAPQKQILIADRNAITLSAIIKDTGITADENGKKIIKAGTPLTGDLLKRQEGFSKGTADTATAVLLHNYDVTEGPTNGAIIAQGFVDLDKLDKDIQDLYSTSVVGTSRVNVIRGNDQLTKSVTGE